MPTLAAVYCVRNEADIIEHSLRAMTPHVDAVVMVDTGSTDTTLAIAKDICGEKLQLHHYKAGYAVDMGAVRTFALQQTKTDWYIQCDADEVYPQESLEEIKRAIANAGAAISFRVPYYNLAWRPGWVQANFDHTPDRVYRTDVVEAYRGVLPNDMTYVKREHLLAPNKTKGDVGVLEYDNPNDQSFEHPKQPILRNAPFYHLARTRGYFFEHHKWWRYNMNLHPEWNDQKVREMTCINAWVSGQYTITKHQIPTGVPTLVIPKPKVSVIITNYNYAQYVSEALASVRAQTYQPHEIIIIDDCSTDGSDALLQQEQGIVYHRHTQNLGPAHARNAGLARATGDYILFLDADDKLDPTYLEKVVPLMKGDVQVVYTDLTFFGDQEGTHQFPDTTRESIRAWQTVPSVCALVDRRAYELAGGYDPSEMFEDWGLWLRMRIRHDFNFAHLKEPLFHYRHHLGGRCEENNKQQAVGFSQLRERYGITRQPD